MTDPEVLFQKQFDKIKKQLDKNRKECAELIDKHTKLSKQYDDFVKRRDKR